MSDWVWQPGEKQDQELLIVNDNTLRAALTTQNSGFELKAETLLISRSKIIRPGSIRSGHKR